MARIQHGWPIEATAIGLILLFNAALGVYQEQRSEAALARLKVFSGAQAWVLRDGEFVRLPARDVVPGDWLRLEAGDVWLPTASFAIRTEPCWMNPC